MSLPAGLFRGVQAQYGLVLGVYPSSDPSFDVEIQRASGSSTGTFIQIARLDPTEAWATLVHRDLLPNDNVTRCYRARHVKNGYTAGAWTSIVSGKPGSLTVSRPPMLELSGRAVTGILQLSTGADIRYGSAASASYITKTLRIHAASAQSLFSTAQTRCYSNGIAARTINTVQFAVPIDIPVGTTIVGAQTSVTKPNAGQVQRIRLQRITGNTALTLWDKTSTQTGEHTLTTTTLSQLVSSSQTYNFLLDMSSTAGSADDNIAHWWQVTYRTPAVSNTR